MGTKADIAWARTALRDTLRRCFLSLAGTLEREATAAVLMGEPKAAEKFRADAAEIRERMPRAYR